MTVNLCQTNWPEVECGGHGQCISGVCVCDSGWSGRNDILNLVGYDCSINDSVILALWCIVAVAAFFSIVYNMSYMILAIIQTRYGRNTQHTNPRQREESSTITNTATTTTNHAHPVTFNQNHLQHTTSPKLPIRHSYRNTPLIQTYVQMQTVNESARNSHANDTISPIPSTPHINQPNVNVNQQKNVKHPHEDYTDRDPVAVNTKEMATSNTTAMDPMNSIQTPPKSITSANSTAPIINTTSKEPLKHNNNIRPHAATYANDSTISPPNVSSSPEVNSNDMNFNINVNSNINEFGNDKNSNNVSNMVLSDTRRETRKGGMAQHHHQRRRTFDINRRNTSGVYSININNQSNALNNTNNNSNAASTSGGTLKTFASSTILTNGPTSPPARNKVLMTSPSSPMEKDGVERYEASHNNGNNNTSNHRYPVNKHKWKKLVVSPIFVARFCQTLANVFLLVVIAIRLSSNDVNNVVGSNIGLTVCYVIMSMLYTSSVCLLNLTFLDLSRGVLQRELHIKTSIVDNPRATVWMVAASMGVRALATCSLLVPFMMNDMSYDTQFVVCIIYHVGALLLGITVWIAYKIVLGQPMAALEKQLSLSSDDPRTVTLRNFCQRTRQIVTSSGIAALYLMSLELLICCWPMLRSKDAYLIPVKWLMAMAVAIRNIQALNVSEFNQKSKEKKKRMTQRDTMPMESRNRGIAPAPLPTKSNHPLALKPSNLIDNSKASENPDFPLPQPAAALHQHHSSYAASSNELQYSVAG